MMNKAETAAILWKRFLRYEQLLIAEHGLEKYLESVVFVIDKFPKENCKRCYGRGYIGWDVPTGRCSPCGCLDGFALKGKVDVENGDKLMDFKGRLYIAEVEEVEEDEEEVEDAEI